MRRTKLTKHPSFAQMKKMAENLRDKYKAFATVQSFVYAHKSGKVDEYFWMSVTDKFYVKKKTWEGLWVSYRYRIKRRD